MSVEHLPARSRVDRPWRNGGGSTCDIALFPQGAGDDEFLWRASLATIAAAGPFSAWPGIDRSFMLLEGELVISIDGAGRRLRAGDAAIPFAGAATVSAEPIGGECRALNLMTRRGRVRARLERWGRARPTAADVLVLVAEAATTVRLDGRPLALAAHDAVRLGPAEMATLECDRAVIVAELFG